MIGGEDLILPGKPRPDDGDFMLRYLSYAWPDAIVEDAASPNCMPIRCLLPMLRAPAPREFFVYRNEASFGSWQQTGATNDNGDEMIHVLIGSDEITCVVDRQDSWSGRLVLQLFKMLKHKRRQIVEPRTWVRKRLYESRSAGAP